MSKQNQMASLNPQAAPFQPASPLSNNMVAMPAVDPATAKQTIESRQLPTVWQRPAVFSLAANVVPGAPSIAEMARALKNDPQLIYEHVYNNVEFVPLMGVQKGPVGTLLDSVGSSFDQSGLLAALLRQAGFTANLEVGVINLTQAQAFAWLGVTDSNVNTVVTLLGNGGIPVTLVGTFPNQTFDITHCWVKVNIGTVAVPNWVVMDPSFKTYTTISPVNLATATGYNQATFLTQARSGYTIDASGNWVQNLNRANIRSQLQAYSNNLVAWIKANLPGASTDQIIGGRQIVPVVLPVTFPANLPYQKVGDVPTEFTGDFSNAYKVTLQVIATGMNVTLTSDQVYGKRLSWTYTANGANFTPKLVLDGTVVGTATDVAAGTFSSLQIVVTHNAYPSGFANQTVFLSSFSPNLSGFTGQDYYLIGTAFGPTGQAMLDYHEELQALNKFNGGSDLSEPVMGERLTNLWLNYCVGLSRTQEIINRMTSSISLVHHQVGMMSYRNYPSLGNTTATLNIQGVSTGGAALNATTANLTGMGWNTSMHGYTLEMLALQQASGVDSAATTRVIDVASAAGTKLYKGTQANWSTVSPALTGYSGSELSTIQNNFLNFGWVVLIPQAAGQVFNHLTMNGYSALSSFGGAFGSIFASYAGGTSSNPTPPWQPPIIAQRPKDPKKGDPVNFRTGAFTIDVTDMELGSGEYPYRVGFGRSYNSSKRLQSGPLGLGWKHSWMSTVAVGSDVSKGLGSESPIDGALSIAEMFVTLDMLSDAALPVDKMGIVALCHQWWTDQMTGNIVTVSLPEADYAFTKLADGTYNPRPDDASTLTLSGGLYTHKTPQKVTSNFNSSGQLATVVFPEGVTITLSYTAGVLTSVSNGLSRTLTLSYTAGKLTSVTDGTGRSISYTVDGSDNLVTYVDANAKSITYQYGLAGQMTKFFLPANPAVAFITNSYDSLNRVMTQANARGQVSNFYFAGSRSEVTDPLLNKEVTYWNNLGNAVREIDPLGFATTYQIDGRGRITKKTMPEGNSVQYVLDSNNNPLSVTQIAKSGSGLANIVENFTYDPLWAKVQTYQDGRGNTTTFSWDAVTGKLLTVSRPAIGGLTPKLTNKWNSRGQLLSAIDESGVQTQFIYDAATEKLLSKIVNTNWRCTVGGTVTVGNVATINVNDAGLPGGTKAKSYTVIAGDTLAKIATGLANAVNGDSQLAALGIVAYLDAAVVSLSTSPGNATTFTGSTSGGATVTLTLAAGLNITSSYGYDSVGNVNAVTDPRSNQRTFLFDPLRRNTQITEPTPFSYLTKFTFDDNGNLTKQERQTGTTPAWQTYSWTYSTTNQKLTEVDPANKTITWTYDGSDRVQTLLDAQSRLWQFGYDALDRQNQVTDPTSVVSDMRTFTPNGLVASVKDSANNITQFTWDGFDREDKTIYADATFEQNSSYDANGNVLTFLTRSGSSIVYTWDALDRMVTKAPTGQPTVSNTYDLAGRLIQTSKPVVSGDPSSGALQFFFDSAGRFFKEQYPDGKTVTHVLDGNENRTKTTWPDGYFIDRSYDQLDRLANIKLNGSATNAVVFSYNQLSQRTGMTYSNGASVTITPQQNEDVTGITHTMVGSAVTFTYGYNNVHEVLSQNVSDSLYVFHPAAAGTVAYGTVDNGNKYPTVGGTAYTYSGNKCLTGDGVWTFGYDTEDHLLTATKTGTSASFVYDPTHRQSQKTVGTTKSRYVYSEWQMIAQYNGASGALQNRYVFGDEMDEPLIRVTSAGVLTFYHADKQGSIVGVSNATGGRANRNKFSEFGEIVTLGGTIFGFTAQRYDSETGLYYYKNRYYSPKIGRFLQPDPIGYDSGDLNLYTFVGNSPLVYIDPLGLQETTPQGRAMPQADPDLMNTIREGKQTIRNEQQVINDQNKTKREKGVQQRVNADPPGTRRYPPVVYPPVYSYPPVPHPYTPPVQQPKPKPKRTIIKEGERNGNQRNRKPRKRTTVTG